MNHYIASTRKHVSVTLPIFLILTLIFCFPTDHADADIGPKPTMEFEFEFETGDPLEVLDGVLYECDQSDCSDAQPLEELGPQGFSCTADSCSSMAYSYREYHRLLIRFSDGKERQSNVFQSNSFDSTFKVLVREDDLVVEKIHGSANPFLLNMAALFLGSILTLLLSVAMLFLLIITILRAGEEKADYQASRGLFISLWVVMGFLLVAASFFSLAIPIAVIVEATLGLIYAIFRKRSKLTTVTMVILANMVTLPPFWAASYFISGDFHIIVFIVAEIIIWLVESGVLYLTQRKTIRFWEATLLSFVLNGISALIGLLLPL